MLNEGNRRRIRSLFAYNQEHARTPAEQRHRNGLIRSLTRSLSLPEVQAMAALMGQVKVNYGTQSLPDGWADRTRSHWTEIAAKHGLSVLREAVEAHMSVSDFLPKKSEINRHVGTVLEQRDTARQAGKTRNHLQELETWKQQWLRERAEELGIVQTSDSLEVGA